MASVWSAQPAYHVLDTDFKQAQAWLDLWQCWRSHAGRPALLHYVGVLSEPDAAALQATLEAAADGTLAHLLGRRCYGLGPGFHRILLEHGQLSLTLCVGELQTVLTQLEMLADTVLAGPAAVHWDKWLYKTLARNCRRGAYLVLLDCALPDARLLADAGFAPQPASPDPHITQAVAQTTAQTSHTITQARYSPGWEIRNSRRAAPASSRAPGRCAVVGAGIAGASVARALALRGWQVEVLDTQAQPAGGASGLPVGLVVPHHSADDNPRSRLSRAGTRLMLHHAGQMLHADQDWQASGVLERILDAATLAAVEAEVLSQSAPAPTGWASARAFADTPGLWHPHAAWIKPSRMVAQWLAHPHIRFQGHACVHTLERSQGQWLLRAADSRELARADNVVLANAYSCVQLLQRTVLALPEEVVWIDGLTEKLAAMERLYGTLSLGPCPEPGARDAGRVPFPVNGHGSLVWGVPTASGPHWYAGSTFRSDAAQHADLAQEHAANRLKLATLLPQAAHAVATQFAGGRVQAWQSERCVSHDRLPLVGPLDQGTEPTLWLSAAMGARGLSFSALCAELLVAQVCCEPLPVERTLARALDTRRPWRRKPTAHARVSAGAKAL